METVKTKKQKPLESSKKTTAPHKLMMIIAVVDRRKNDFYTDILQENEVNITLTLRGNGTADERFFSNIEKIDNNKAVIFGVVRQDKVKELLSILNDKFDSVKNGKGIAFTIPLSSVIGVSSYMFLANKEK